MLAHNGQSEQGSSKSLDIFDSNGTPKLFRADKQWLFTVTSNSGAIRTRLFTVTSNEPHKHHFFIHLNVKPGIKNPTLLLFSTCYFTVPHFSLPGGHYAGGVGAAPATAGGLCRAD